MKNVTNFQISPFKVEISEKCKQTIKALVCYNPSQRPSIKELLDGDYIKEMCKNFKWDLSKLIKIKKMKKAGSFESKISDINTSKISDMNTSKISDINTSFNYNLNKSHLLNSSIMNKSNSKTLQIKIPQTPKIKNKIFKTTREVKTTKNDETTIETINYNEKFQIQMSEVELKINSEIDKNQKVVSKNIFLNNIPNIDLNILKSNITIESIYINPLI